MRKVQRSEIVDYATYSDARDAVRASIMETKRPRRIHVGAHLTFLFENADTVRYQVQEMMRAERIVRESDIQHELDTYNALLGDDGELGCCLLIELDDPDERDRKLRQWRLLPQHIYLRCDDGTMIRPTFDRAQIDEERISAVQYLKFGIGQRTPVALGCDLPDLTTEATLSNEQRAALLADLAAG